jgi:hypothetical protein
MGGFGRALAILVAVLIAVAIGAGVYNAGMTAGLAEAAQQAAATGDPLPANNGFGYGYGPYWHGPGGFGFFGILFAILGVFLVIGLIRGAMGWNRWGGGPGGRGDWGGRRERLEEFHREMHRRETGGERPAGA